jgi:outer membrane protein assembly factor BamB/tRNA A-37 threonylcarbamoyl transferase component Bud32
MSGSTAGTAGKSRVQRTLAAGTVLEDRYEIQRVAGRGGMSTVYVARDLRFSQVERLCAIKEMFDVDPDARVRALRLVNFERESALLATLSHPAIPRIYDYFSRGGLVYLVLEYIDGEDLERVLANQKMAFQEEQIIRWGIEICDVLVMLHDQKPDPIIFRDLKPSNIMLRVSGQIVLIDFGIARTIQGRQRGTMIGTEGYAPPEQYRGIADARGDIYALGATLHHMATNSDPRLETPFTFSERPIRSLNQDISEELAAVIMKMVAYNPADRYQSVHHLRADLEIVQQRQAAAAFMASGMSPIQSSPPAASPASEPIRPVRAGTTVLGVPPVPAAPAPQPEVKPVPTVERRTVKKRAARRRRDDAAIERLLWATATGDEVRGSAAFDGQAFAIGSYDGHVYSVGVVDGIVRWRFRTGRGVVSRPAVSRETLVFGSEDYSIYAVDRSRGSLIWSHRTGMPVRSSPAVDDTSVVVGSDDAWVYSLDLESGKVNWRQRTWGPVRSSPVFAEGRVLIGCDDTYLYALNARTGRVEWRASCGAPIQSAPLYADNRVFVASRGGTVTAYSMSGGEKLWQFDAKAPVLASLQEVDGTLIFGAVDGALFGLACEDGTPRWVERHANQITASTLLAGPIGYVGTIDGDCICFNTADGDLIWRYQVGGSIVSTPAYGNGVIVVGSTDGRICGLMLNENEIQLLEKGN